MKRKIRILFIGNSHTYVNDLPALVVGYAEHDGVECDVVMLAHPGWFLDQHTNDPEAYFNIRYGHYDYVVLQEHSHPFGPEERYFAAVRTLTQWIKEAGSKPVIYMTWAREKMPEDQESMASAHRKIADETGAILAPVGEKWWEWKASHPEKKMYADDGAHASPDGSSFAAGIIWECIHNELTGHYKSLLQTTQNTRDLGGYHTQYGGLTRAGVLLRSDVQYYPSAGDCRFLKEQGITTIIDMRSAKDTQKKPSGFVDKEGFIYLNFPIDEGSGVPESMDEVPRSYMRIANAKEMVHVFRSIAKAKTGVMFNCTAGKDRTGVVSAILLLLAGVDRNDIIQDYVLTREYGKERLALIHQNFPEIDMNIVTPCEAFMSEFLRLFTERYGDIMQYFKQLGLNTEEIELLRSKLV